MRAVWLRRGPWGVIPTEAPSQAALVVTSLSELVDRVDACWVATSSVWATECRQADTRHVVR